METNFSNISTMGSAEDALTDNEPRLAKIRPMRVEMHNQKLRITNCATCQTARIILMREYCLLIEKFDFFVCFYFA